MSEEREFYMPNDIESGLNATYTHFYSPLDEESDSSESLFTPEENDNFIRAAKILVPLIGFMKSSEYLCQLPIFYIYKDDIAVGPSLLYIFVNLYKASYTLNPLVSNLFDNYITSSKRLKNYMYFGCILNLILSALIAINRSTNVILVTAIFILWNFGLGIAVIAANGVVVRSIKYAGSEFIKYKLNVYAMSYFISDCFMSYISGVLLLYFRPSIVYGMSGIVPLISICVTYFIPDVKMYNNPYRFNARVQYRTIKNYLANSRIFFFLLFLLVKSAVPLTDNCMYYFYTDELHFKSHILGLSRFLSGITIVVTNFFYTKYLSEYNPRLTYLYSMMIFVPYQSLLRWNLKIGISDPVFVVGHNIVSSSMNNILYNPIRILTALMAPDGLENTFTSITELAVSIGRGLSNVLSAVIVYLFGITDKNFSNLTMVVLFCTAMELCPVFFYKSIPTKYPKPIEGISMIGDGLMG